MKNILVLAIIIAVGWYFTQRNKGHELAEDVAEPAFAAESPTQSNVEKFHCDGREYCSQMTSCEEATFFIRNCPNAKMDGNHDGVPCESQWCK